MRFRDEEGQSIILVALAMSLFLIGAVGLAVDGSHMYAQRQMAQTAADAAAVAGILSIFDGTNVVSTNTAKFSTASGFTCTTSDAETPCVYARDNGFGGSASDTVTIAYPAASTEPGVALSASDAVPLIQVTVSRSVSTTLMQFLGPAATTVTATAVAAITSVVSPTPLLITHPTLTQALQLGGSTTIKICGGPSQSIEVDSSDAAAFAFKGTVDLSQAGPADPGTCTTGTGANFGVFGGPAANPGVLLGTTGTYISPHSPVQDPLAFVAQPSVPAAAAASVSVPTGTDGCTSGPCILYSPGLYVGGLNLKNTTVLFKPGLYYLQGGGLTMKNVNGGGANYSANCVGCAADPNTGTGMLIFDTGPAGSVLGSNPSGGFQLATGQNISFQGPTLTTTNAAGNTVPAAPYYGITFWEDRTADANSHQFGQGNGCVTVFGTIYITNTQATMAASAAHYQQVGYGGTPCSATIVQGDIIVSALQMNGNASITMDLVPYGFLDVRQVALVQ